MFIDQEPSSPREPAEPDSWNDVGVFAKPNLSQNWNDLANRIHEAVFAGLAGVA
ncbi:hypothetical protein [Sphingobium sp. SA916]|uniref:hypothetical protein n=1 Tax=Sphingobium sp. SA916 TaxID=1851207 RepID=UPI0015595EE8|nr:hypothetical protein [Sphingobium sp. SA916]